MEKGTVDTIRVETTRFGVLEAPRNQVLTMEKPVLGFEQCKEYVAIKTGDMHPFVWLQSLSEADVAFLMINPKLLYADYTIQVNKREVEDIGVTDDTSVEIFVIVTVGPTLEESTVNLQGPIVINTESRKAKQLVLANSHYSVAAPLQGRTPVDQKEISKSDTTSVTVGA